MKRTFFRSVVVGAAIGGVSGGADGPMLDSRSSPSYSTTPGVATVLHAVLPEDRGLCGVLSVSRDDVSIFGISRGEESVGIAAGETAGVIV